MERITVYTDGGVDKNGQKINRGAWAFIAHNEKNECIHNDSGLLINTTNNRAELTAALKALGWAKENRYKIYLRSDSQYLCKGFNEWMYKWQQNNFEGKLNSDLWEDLFKIRKSAYKFVWVKGHADNVWNQMADELAKKTYKDAI